MHKCRVYCDTSIVAHNKLPASFISYCTLSMIDVIIIGSGVAGLSAALSLQNSGFNVKVFEHDFDFVDRKQGYGLTLTYSVDGPLSKLGVLDECIANNCPSHCHYIFSTSGDVLGYYGRELKSHMVEEKPDQGGNRGNLRIPRQDLRMMLIRKLKPDTIAWGYSLTGYCESSSCVSPTFKKRTFDGTERVESFQCSVLVGADGIRSIVRQLRDSKHQKFLKTTYQTTTDIKRKQAVAVGPSPTHYLGVAVIIGLSAIAHPHVNNRGFYVVDGENRMFTMPYVAPRIVESENGTQSEQSSSTAQATGQTMWQLSFSGLDEAQASALRRSGPEAILTEALRRTEGWFVPVQDMIRNTLPGELWATGLYDRDPMAQFEKNSVNNGTHTKKNKVAHTSSIQSTSTTTDTSSVAITDGKAVSGGLENDVLEAAVEAEPVGGTRVTVIGDAAHPMSMFKGQGANQALADGPLLAQWLLHGTSKGPGEAGKNKQKRKFIKERHTEVAEGVSSLPAEQVGNAVEARPTESSTGNVESLVSKDLPPDLSFLANQGTVFTRLRCFEREMCDRSTPKVLASRQAAAHLHSTAVLDDIFGIAGVKIANAAQNSEVLATLREANVSAALGNSLDQAVKDALEKYIE